MRAQRFESGAAVEVREADGAPFELHKFKSERAWWYVLACGREVVDANIRAPRLKKPSRCAGCYR